MNECSFNVDSIDLKIISNFYLQNVKETKKKKKKRIIVTMAIKFRYFSFLSLFPSHSIFWMRNNQKQLHFFSIFFIAHYLLPFTVFFFDRQLTSKLKSKCAVVREDFFIVITSTIEPKCNTIKWKKEREGERKKRRACWQKSIVLLQFFF